MDEVQCDVFGKSFRFVFCTAKCKKVELYSKNGEQAVHLVLQCGKLFQNVTQLVSLSGTVMTVDLYQTAEWL